MGVLKRADVPHRKPIDRPKIRSPELAKAFMKSSYARTKDPAAKMRILKQAIARSEGKAREYLIKHWKRVYETDPPF